MRGENENPEPAAQKGSEELKTITQAKTIMPAPIDPSKKAAIRRAYLQGVPLSRLSRKYGVSDRAIQLWIKHENWNGITRPVMPDIPARIDGDELPDDPIDICDHLIARFYRELKSMERMKDAAPLSREIREWLRYKEDLMRPRSALEFADLFLRSGYDVREFVACLKQRREELN